MATSISMASNALLLIGDSPINALSENQSAANLYDEIYEYILCEHTWTFATKEQYLSRLTQSPARETGYANAFQNPTDMLYLWAVFPNQIEYRMVGDLLYSNADSLLALYAYRPPESVLPPHFVKALEYKLAADFAISEAEDENKSRLFELKYQNALGVAMAKDSQQAPSQQIRNNPIRLSRGRR